MQELFNFFEEMKADPESDPDMIERAEKLCEKRALRIKRNEDEIREFAEKLEEKEREKKEKSNRNSMLILLFLMILLDDDNDDEINFSDIFSSRNRMKPKF